MENLHKVHWIHSVALMENTTTEHPWSLNAVVTFSAQNTLRLDDQASVYFGQKISIKAPYSPEKESHWCVTVALITKLI